MAGKGKRRRSPGTSSRQIRYRVREHTLVVPHFRLRRFGQTFLNPTEIHIDLTALGAYLGRELHQPPRHHL
jgi:hypothetical protein